MDSLALVDHLARTQDQRADIRPSHLTELPAATSSQWRYWRLLYEVRRRRPYSVLGALDIGTSKGISALHLASGAEPNVPTISLDINPEAGEHIRALALQEINYPELKLVTVNSLHYDDPQEYGVVFIDGLHGFDQVYTEYLKYRQQMRSNGLIFFDDLHLHAGMEAMWSCIHEPKMRLDDMHFTGFGVVSVLPTHVPLDLPAAREQVLSWCKRIALDNELDRAEC